MKTNESSGKDGSMTSTGQESLIPNAAHTNSGAVRERPASTFSFLFFLGFLMFGPSSLAQEVPPNLGDSEPIDDAMVFRDDELLYVDLDYSTLSIDVAAPTSDDLNHWQWVGTHYVFDVNYYNDPKPVAAAAAGRIDDPLHDHLALSMMTLDGQTRVHLYNTTAADTSTPPLLQATLRGPTSTTSPTRRYLDTAVGDLDGYVDEKGFYHDEVVVVRTALNDTTGEAVMVDVLDYRFNVLATYNFSGAYQDVAVTLGDFNNDHIQEIAIAMVKPSTAGKLFVVKTGKLVHGPDSDSLVFNSTSSDLVWDGFEVAIACGDFRGKGERHIIASGGSNFYVFGTDAQLNLTLKKTYVSDFTSTSDLKTKVRLVPGLFRFDPSSGYNINRRQLAAVALRRTSAKVWLQFEFFDMDDTYQLVKEFRTDITVDSGNRNYPEFDLSVAAANAVGHGQSKDATSPLMQLGTIGQAYIDDRNPNNIWIKQLWNVSLAQKTVTPTGYVSAEGGILRYNYPYAAYVMLAIDSDGDSWRLGPPVQVEMEGVPKVEGMVDEPPKHVDYLPVNPDHPELEWEVFNIGGFDTFNVELKDTAGKTMTSTITDTSSHEYGASASLEGSATFSKGALVAKAAVTGYGKLKGSYQYETSTSDVNKYYYSKDAKVVRDTNRDDNVGGKVKHIDAWMYPIYGFSTGVAEMPYGWYQVLIPGPEIPHWGGGFQWDEYQPFHENHNILSYPDYTKYTPWSPNLAPDTDMDTVWPSDVGEYYDPMEDKIVLDILNKNYMGPFIYDGNNETLDLTFSQSYDYTHEWGYTNKLTGKAEIAFKASGKAHIPFLGNAKAQAALDISFNTEQSWGHSEVTEQGTSGSKGLTITKPAAAEDNKAYGFKTAAYIDTGGTFRVAHAANPLASDRSRNWWLSQYGRKPDPALNLPFRFTHHEPYAEHLVEYWTLSEDFDRDYMRGFLMRASEPTGLANTNELLSQPIYDGDMIYLCARVYNYSLNRDTGAFNVTFYYGLWDGAAGQLVPGHTWETQSGMTVRVNNLDGTTEPGGTSMVEVRVPWNTATLGQVAKSTYGYRFKVCLDEMDEVDEIHEGWVDVERTEIMPGGNNEGTFPWGAPVYVHPRPAAQGAWVASPDIPEWVRELFIKDPSAKITFSQDGERNPEHDHDVNLSREALSISTPEGFRSDDNILVADGKKVQLRAHIQTESMHPHNFVALFYDGHPNKGGKPLAMRISKGLPAGDSYISVPWTPDKYGRHNIWVRVVGDLRYPDRQNFWDSLKVVVTPPQATQHKRHAAEK